MTSAARGGRVSRLPLRVRLVAGFSAAMFVVLAAAGAFVYWRVQYALDRGLDTELTQATRTIQPLVGRDGAVPELAAADATGAAWQVLDAGGRVLSHGGPAGGTPLVSPRDLARVDDGTTVKDIGTMLPAADQPYRAHVTRLPVEVSGPDGTAEPTYLFTAVRRDHRDEALRELLLQLVLAGCGALIVTAFVGERLSRASLMPVERYRRRAREIARGASGLRLDVPDGRDDEVTRLGHTLNDMLAELERALEFERRFVNEASHELRTPLTLLTSRIQLARRRTRGVEEHEHILDELATDVGELSALARQLLELGVSANELTGETEVVEATSRLVAARSGDDPDGVRQVLASLPRGQVASAITPFAWERLLNNLVDNALLHGQPPVEVAVSSVLDASGSGWVRLAVTDAGAGMDAALLAIATDRFARSDEARGRPGAGLGLSLVRSIAENAGGQVRLCFAGDHTRVGRDVDVRCSHDDRMTVAVLLRRTNP